MFLYKLAHTVYEKSTIQDKLFFLSFRHQDTSLWSQALSYFARKEEDCRKHIREVLQRILL